MAEQVHVEIGLPDDELVDELQQQLAEEGAENLEVTRSPQEPGGIGPQALPLIPIAVAAVVASGGFASIIMWLRTKLGCQQILRVTKDDFKSVMNCDVKDGRLIVITEDGMKVEIVEVPDAFDLTEVLKAAMSGAADAVKKAADEAGASTTDPAPAAGGMP